MEKIKIPNSYDEWTYSDCVNMHRLYLKWSERFIWSNLFWTQLVLFLLVKNVALNLVLIIPTFLLLMKLKKDYEFICKPPAPNQTVK